MNHKWIMGVFIAAFCLVFVGIFLYSLMGYGIVDLDRDTERYLTFTAQSLITFGGLMISISSTVGAFTVEDGYARLGLLFFAAVATVYVLLYTL